MSDEQRVVVIRGEEQIDVTEAVRTMYDLLHSSMDWGSGFLSIEEVLEVTRLAAVCGFLDLDGANDQIEGYLRSLSGTCPICGYVGVFKLGEVTAEGRVARLESKWGGKKADEHHAILIQPRNEPAYLFWPDLETVPDPTEQKAV